MGEGLTHRIPEGVLPQADGFACTWRPIRSKVIRPSHACRRRDVVHREGGVARADGTLKVLHGQDLAAQGPMVLGATLIQGGHGAAGPLEHRAQVVPVPAAVVQAARRMRH